MSSDIVVEAGVVEEGSGRRKGRTRGEEMEARNIMNNLLESSSEEEERKQELERVVQSMEGKDMPC